MADLIVGYPSNLTTVSSGTGGNIRVTYQPWELDWEFFDLIAVDGTHYLADTTTAVSAAINAKGGAEHLGYWFEIGVAFPSANWNSGDRISPQRQAAINQFATFVAALAAMAMDDTFLVWYSTATNNRVWGLGCTFNNIAGSFWGMLSRMQIWIAAQVGVYYQGNLLAQAQQASVVNTAIILQGNGICIYHIPGAGQEGQGLLIKRCLTWGGRGGAINITRALAGTIRIENCVAIEGVGNVLGVANCGAIYNSLSFHSYRLGNLVNNTTRNCVAMECVQCYLGTGGCQNCADTDGTLPIGFGNLRNQEPRTQFVTFFDLASPGQKKFALDFRIDRSSVLNGTGVAVAGITKDADNQARPDPPSMGPYEPYEVCYAPGAEIIRGAAKRGVKT